MKYIKKPVIIDAWQYTQENHLNVISQLNADNVDYRLCRDGTVAIETLEGIMKVSWNDFVIKGVNGEYYPCKLDIFRLTYEPME